MITITHTCSRCNKTWQIAQLADTVPPCSVDDEEPMRHIYKLRHQRGLSASKLTSSVTVTLGVLPAMMLCKSCQDDITAFVEDNCASILVAVSQMIISLR